MHEMGDHQGPPLEGDPGPAVAAMCRAVMCTVRV